MPIKCKPNSKHTQPMFSHATFRPQSQMPPIIGPASLSLPKMARIKPPMPQHISGTGLKKSPNPIIPTMSEATADTFFAVLISVSYQVVRYLFNSFFLLDAAKINNIFCILPVLFGPYLVLVSPLDFEIMLFHC